jgi:hypothetical protein
MATLRCGDPDFIMIFDIYLKNSHIFLKNIRGIFSGPAWPGFFDGEATIVCENCSHLHKCSSKPKRGFMVVFVPTGICEF